MDAQLGDLAISYYTLYAEHQRDDEEHYSLKQAYWEDDVWTAEEEEDVQKALEESFGLCQIADTSAIKENPDAWNQFYDNHQNKFFKDRHYLAEAFPKIFGTNPEIQLDNPTLIEFGCGVGNSLLPLLANSNDRWSKVIGVDLSSVAIDILRADERFRQAALRDRADAVVADLTSPTFFTTTNLSCTVACLFFCLSAMHPDHEQQRAVHNVIRTVEPGGWVLLRDYGRWDQAQVALGQQRNKQIADHYYQKHDGTKVYYFSTDDVCRLMLEGGMVEKVQCQYIRRVYQNRRTGETRRRVWVQGMFRKTP